MTVAAEYGRILQWGTGYKLTRSLAIKLQTALSISKHLILLHLSRANFKLQCLQVTLGLAVPTYEWLGASSVPTVLGFRVQVSVQPGGQLKLNKKTPQGLIVLSLQSFPFFLNSYVKINRKLETFYNKKQQKYMIIIIWRNSYNIKYIFCDYI